jgi:DNA-binding response OmpR family regulator
MIVDNDNDIANLFKVFLECNWYNVDAYTNPIDALNNFRKNSYNLIILDLKMPNMDGISLYQKIVAIDDKVIIVLLLLIKDWFRICKKE